jgi:hypothetical protein
MATARLHAQGGPPMITDDPGTPGNGHWEINTAWTEQRSPGSTLVGLPLLDANYGVGAALQLNYQSSWNVLRNSGMPTESGVSDSQLAVKWRFYDAGDAGLQVSMYPRLSFLDPGSDSDRRGTADADPAFLMPFEVRRDFGAVAVNADFGHTFSAEHELRGWMGGVCLGHNLSKGWEIDLELHGTASDGLDRSELTLNFGTRIDFSQNATLLLAVGRDTQNTLGPVSSLLTYVGLQVRL